VWDALQLQRCVVYFVLDESGQVLVSAKAVIRNHKRGHEQLCPACPHLASSAASQLELCVACLAGCSEVQGAAALAALVLCGLVMGRHKTKALSCRPEPSPLLEFRCACCCPSGADDKMSCHKRSGVSGEVRIHTRLHMQ
jgi:hypothetical protein